MYRTDAANMDPRFTAKANPAGRIEQLSNKLQEVTLTHVSSQEKSEVPSCQQPAPQTENSGARCISEKPQAHATAGLSFG